MHRTATVGGTITENAPSPVFNDVLLPGLGLVQVRPDIEVPRNQSLNLQPGTYGKLELKPGSTLELIAGTYHFEQIDAGSNSIFKPDVRDGSMIVNVLGNIATEQGVKFVPIAAPGDIAALKILIQTEGARVDLGRNTEVFGTILSPEAVIDVRQEVMVEGALYGRRVALGRNSTVVALPAVDLLTDASLRWLGFKNDCEDSTGIPAGTSNPLMRLVGQAVYGCQRVDLGSAVVISGNVAGQQNVLVNSACLVTGDVRAVSGTLDIGRSAEVTGGVDAGGRVRLAVRAKVGTSVNSGGNVVLYALVEVAEDVTAAGRVRLNGRASVGGVITEDAVVAPISDFFLPLLGLNAPGEPVDLARNEVTLLPPGAYGQLTLKQNATLQLTAGEYRFDSIDIGQRSVIELDLIDGNILISVVGDLDVDQRTEMRATVPNGENALERILIQVQGKRVNLGQNGLYLGTIVAPNADVELRQLSTLNGALFGHSIRLGQQAEVHVEAAIDLMLATAVDWLLPSPGESDDDEDAGPEKQKRSTFPKLVRVQSPVMEIHSTQDGMPVIRITANVGFTGDLYAKSSLIGGDWKWLAELDGSAGFVEFIDESTAKTTVRFYRLVNVKPLSELVNATDEQR